jgi:MYXO-CTERM domain-containing protein
MTNIDHTAGGRASRLSHIVRAWWPVPALIATALIAQQLLVTSRYDVGDHAAEHLAGATAPFMAAAVLSILFWATPRARRQVDLLVISGMWFATTLLVMVGNLRVVVDDLVAAGYSHTPTGSVLDVADHSLANSSVWYAAAAAAALLLVAAWRRRRHIGNRATIGAVVATLIIPPWIIPGAGVIVLAIVRLVQCGRAAEIGFDRHDAGLDR